MVNSSSSKKRKVSSFPRDTLEQAETVIHGWQEVGKKLNVPNLNVEKFVNKLQEAKEYVDKAEQLKLERAKAIQERNVCLSQLWDLTKRVRNAAKATFGDYSSELELLQGTQTNERGKEDDSNSED